MLTGRTSTANPLSLGIHDRGTSRAKGPGTDFDQLFSDKLQKNPTTKTLKPKLGDKAKSVMTGNEVADQGVAKEVQPPTQKIPKEFSISNGLKARLEEQQQAREATRLAHSQQLQISSSTNQDSAVPVGELTQPQLELGRQAHTETNLDGQLLALKSTLAQLKEVMEQQNNTMAALTSNQEPAFLAAGEQNAVDAGFSSNQSVGQENSGVLFWPGNDIDGLELKASPLADTNIRSPQEQAEGHLPSSLPPIDPQMVTTRPATKSEIKMVPKALAADESSPLSALIGEAKPAAQEQGLLEQKSAEDEGLSFADFFTGQDQNVSSVDGADGQNFKETLAVATSSESGDPQKIENMNSIVKHVRTFINDGGGEMELELSPEGLGKVNLKVNVDSGRVNIMMKADNEVAKRAIEDSLNEMKTSLEGHQLIVETVKIDMMSPVDKDFSQLQDLMKEQENRQFAQQFMDNFNDERDERFGSLFDGFRNYIKEPQDTDLALRSQNRFVGQGKGQSLNIKV